MRQVEDRSVAVVLSTVVGRSEERAALVDDAPRHDLAVVAGKSEEGSFGVAILGRLQFKNRSAALIIARVQAIVTTNSGRAKEPAVPLDYTTGWKVAVVSVWALESIENLRDVLFPEGVSSKTVPHPGAPL